MATQSRRDRLIQERIASEYKPRFERYEPEGMPMAELAEQLLNEEHLGRSRVRAVLRELREADTDHNKRINYDEFYTLIIQEKGEVARSVARRMTTRAMRIVVPQSVIDRHPYLAEYNCKPPPLFIPLITLLEIAVFLYYRFFPGSDDERYSWNTGVARHSPFIYCPSRRYEAWRFVTYMLLHQGSASASTSYPPPLSTHALYNNKVHKWWRIGIVYTLGVIGGSLAHSCVDRGVALVGASGGGYALIGAHFANIIRNWSEMMEGWNTGVMEFLCSPVFQLPIFILLASADTANAVYKRFANTGAMPATRVGISAHIGGMIVGCITGIVFLRDVKINPWERVLGWCCLVLYIVLVAACILVNLFGAAAFNDPGLYPADDKSSCFWNNFTCPYCVTK